MNGRSVVKRWERSTLLCTKCMYVNVTDRQQQLMISRHHCSTVRWPSAASSDTQPPISPDPITHPTIGQPMPAHPKGHLGQVNNSRTIVPSSPSLHNHNHAESIYILNTPPSDLRISLSQHSPTAAVPKPGKSSTEARQTRIRDVVIGWRRAPKLVRRITIRGGSSSWTRLVGPLSALVLQRLLVIVMMMLGPGTFFVLIDHLCCLSS